jgi:hypothetical protein
VLAVGNFEPGRPTPGRGRPGGRRPGAGTLLIEDLAVLARGTGIRRCRAEILAADTTMLRNLPTPAFRWSGGTTTEPEAGDTDTGHQPGGDEALPRDHGPQRGRRVLAAIDTVDATRVLQAADVLAKQLGAAVDAIHVRAAGHRDGLFAGASAEWAHVPLRLLTGPTINTIVAETDADEVVACVLGTQSALVEQRPAGHIALGVIERCAKPVLVVPPAAALSAPPHRVLLPLDHRDRFAGWVAVVCSLLPPEAELVPLLVLTRKLLRFSTLPRATSWASGQRASSAAARAGCATR